MVRVVKRRCLFREKGTKETRETEETTTKLSIKILSAVSVVPVVSAIPAVPVLTLIAKFTFHLSLFTFQFESFLRSGGEIDRSAIYLGYLLKLFKIIIYY